MRRLFVQLYCNKQPGHPGASPTVSLRARVWSPRAGRPTHSEGKLELGRAGAGSAATAAIDRYEATVLEIRQSDR